MDVDPKYIEFFHWARLQAASNPAARMDLDHAGRRLRERDPKLVEDDERADSALAIRLSQPDTPQFGPQSVGVIVSCSFEFQGQLHSLAVPFAPPGGFAIDDKNIPVLHITAREAYLFGTMLRDLAWSHAESQRILRAGGRIEDVDKTLDVGPSV